MGILLEVNPIKKGDSMRKIFFAMILSFSVISFASMKEIPMKKESGTITWNGKKVTGEHQGNIQISNGLLKFESGELSGGNIEVDMSSITCEDIKDAEYNKKLVNHLKSEDFFSTEKFPKATFEITSVMPAKGATYDVKGNLTIKGITKPLQFKLDRMEEKDKWNFKGKIVFDRTDYDVKFKSKKFFQSLGDKMIYDDVTLMVNVYLPKDALKN